MMYGKRIIGTIAYMGGTPSNLEEFTWAWGQMIQYNTEYLCAPGEIIHYERTKLSYHAAARNALADRTRGEWLLMLDMDHAFEPDLAARLVRMMSLHDVDVLTGLYVYRQPPHNPVVFPRVDGRLGYLGAWDHDVDLFEIGAAGAGCLLVRRRVFERIKRELNENPFEIRKAFSEDNSFFDRLLELGIPAYCCPRIENPHLGVRTFTLEDFQIPDPAALSDRHEVEGRILSK